MNHLKMINIPRSKNITFSLIVTLLVFLTLTSCFTSKKGSKSDVEIYPLTDTSGLMAGSLVYALPRTVFTIAAEFERIVEKPGPYSRYAADYLGIDNAIREEKELWSLVGLRLIAREEADPSEYYVIKTSSIFETNVLALKKEGIILDLNPLSFSSVATNMTSEKETNALKFQADLGADEYYQVQRDTAYRRVNIDSSFVRIPYIVEKKKQLSDEQLAEKAAKRLLELRDGKHLILTGEANVFPQSEAPINEINRLEKEYTDLFAGKTFREKRVFNYQIIPDRDRDSKPVNIFYLSKKSGPVGSLSANSVPVTIEFVSENKTKDLTIIPGKTSGSDVKTWDKIFYRVPDIVNIKISNGNEVLLNSRKMIYQYGSVIQLPANYIIGKEK